MFKVALKGILARKRRLLMTSLVIVLGAAFISGTAVLSDLLTRSVNELVDDAYRGIDVVVRSTRAEQNPFSSIPIRKPIDESIVAAVQATDGVRAAVPVVQINPQMLDKEGKPISTFGPPIIAINWIEDRQLSSGTLIRGHAPEAPDEAVLDFKTAKDFGFDLGDELVLQLQSGSGTFRIVGIGGLGTDGKKTTGSRVALLQLPRLQELAGLTGQVNYVSVAADDGVSQSELARRLATVGGEGTEAATGQHFIEENQKSVANLLDLVEQLISAFGYLAAFVAAFVIYNIFSILIAQRTRELALLRAVGASRSQILGGVLLEALVVGVFAAVLGLFGGYGLAVVLKGALGNLLTLSSSPPRITQAAVVTSLVVGVVTTMFSAILPAVRATTVPPVAAMSDVALETGGIGWKRKAFGGLFVAGGITLVLLAVNETLDEPLLWVGVGSAMIFVSLVMLGPLFAGPTSRLVGSPLPALRGIAGRLARDNAERNPKRTTATAVALTIGVGVVTVIAVIASSFTYSFENAFRTQLRGDLIVSGGGFGAGGFDPAVVPAVRAVPGIEQATSLRFAAGGVLNSDEGKQLAARSAAEIAEDPTGEGIPGLTGPAREQVFIIGIEPDSFYDLLDVGNVRPSPAALVDGTVAVQDVVAEKNGWKVGDTVQMWFAELGERSFRLAATYDKPFGGGGSDQYVMTVPTFDQVANVQFRQVVSVYAKVTPNRSIAAVKEAVEKVVTPLAPAAQVQDVGTFVREQTKMLKAFLNIIYVLLALAIVVAVFGIAITMSLSVYERTREIGLLRAIGMDQPGVRSAIRWEAAVISLFGTVLGIVTGVLLSIAFVRGFADQGVKLNLPWTSVVVIAVGGAAAGLLAATWPARRAARQNVLEAIATF